MGINRFIFEVQLIRLGRDEQKVKSHLLKMLTQKEVKAWIELIRWTTGLGTFQFTWNSGKLRIRTSRWRILLNRILSFSNFLSSLYALYSFFHCTTCHPRTMIINGMIFIYISSVTAIRVSHDIFATETIHLINNVLKTNSILGNRSTIIVMN